MKKIFLSAQERFFSREFPKKRLTEPGRPTIPLSRDAAVAQLDRATGYEPVGREFESLQPHQNFEGLMMNNHESFFCTRKSIPQPVRCKSKPLDGTPQCAFHRFCLAATRLPHTPKKTSSYRGCGSPKTGYRYPSRESRLPPHPLWLFPAWGDPVR